MKNIAINEKVGKWNHLLLYRLVIKERVHLFEQRLEEHFGNLKQPINRNCLIRLSNSERVFGKTD